MRRILSLLAFLPLSMPVLRAQDGAAAATPAEAAVPAKTKVTVLRPTGRFADLAEAGFSPASLLTGGGAPPKPFFEFRATVEGLAKAEGATVLLDLSRPFGLNLPQTAEIVRALAKVRAAGKKIVCYLEIADTGALQLAAQCDRVLMAEMGACDLKSLSLNVTHFKDALDLLGVEAEMTRVGEFKGAVEPYVRSSISPGLAKHYRAMLETMNAEVVKSIAVGRKLEPARIRELQAQRLFTAAAAKAAGLVDALVPYAGADRALRTELGGDDLELVDAAPKKAKKNRDLFAMLSEMFRSKKEDDEEGDVDEIVVLHLAGAIADGFSSEPGSMVSGPAVEAIEALTTNDHVKGVVVRVNSPGGSATASEAIRLALVRLAEKKPVVYSMGDLAASGGYWITCIGRPIVAEPTTITGSIGVFSMRFQLGALMRRLGVHGDIVGLDEGAEMDAMDRPWSDAARARMQSFVDEIYERFIAIAAASRKLPPEALRAIAGGRVWSGAQARELGLVDAVGGLDDALALVRKEAKVADDVEVRHAPQPKDFAATIMEKMFDAQARLGAEAGLLDLLGRLSRIDGLLTLVRDALDGSGAPTVYALMPIDLRVR